MGRKTDFCNNYVHFYLLSLIETLAISPTNFLAITLPSQCGSIQDKHVNGGGRNTRGVRPQSH